MTRINAGIHPKHLTDKHLIAEHREIKRVPNLIHKGKFNLDNVPKEFTLGKGHVKFFYDKNGYLMRRYNEIYGECIRRGFNITSYHMAFDSLPSKFCKDYKPTKRELDIILARLIERDPAYKDIKKFTIL